MNTFMNAAQNSVNKTHTHNGAVTNDTTTNPNLDLFFLIGSSRNADITQTFEAAYGNDRERAIRTLLWARDIREGAGERKKFRDFLNHLEVNHFDDLMLVLPYVPVYGRWDDMLVVTSDEARDVVASLIKTALNNGDGLCAKWMPRKGPNAADLRTRMGMSPKQYRKTLVNLTNVVENKMCAKEFEKINFSHVPSVASARYKRAFMRHVPELYSKYIESVKKGESKINANAVFPHDVLKSIRMIGNKTERDAIIAQWDALPNYVGDAKILPMVDTSGSMSVPVGGDTRAIDVSLSLGMYLSEKNTGAFNGAYLTFSHEPKLQVLKGNVITRMKSLARADWGFNTNLERAFTKVLDTAKEKNVPQEDMPDYLLILSDMEFDRCVNDGNKTLYENMRKQYTEAGYELPNVVFWNLNGREGNMPVKAHESGTTLVSGFSPNILKSVLAAEKLTPQAIMDDTIMRDRYNIFQ